MVTFSVCLEMVYQDRPFLDRFGAVADHGVEAVEFWDWESKELGSVKKRLDELDLKLAAIAGTDEPLTDPEQYDTAVEHIERSIEVAERLDCSTVIILTGNEQPDVPVNQQRKQIIRGLREVEPMALEAEITLTLEPLNTAVDHPGYFLETSAEGLSILEAVDSTAVQLLYDIYHQQITEGNIIETVTSNIDDIGHIHIADVPGRCEPGHGELAYPTIIEAIADAGYDRYFGFEFSPYEDSDTAIDRALALK